MKKAIILILGLAFYKIANCQDRLSTITAPTSPAAYIIGAQPASVLTPKSFQALETALYSNFANGSGNNVLPNDFALEFTPYWASDHGLKLEDVLFPKSVWNQLMRNASFSVATSQNFRLQDSTSSSALSFGFRTTLFFGGNADRERIKEYSKTLHDKQRLTAGVVAATIPVYNDASVTNATQFLDKAYPLIVKQLRKFYGVIPDDELALFSDRLYEDVKTLNTYTTDKDQFQTDFNNILIKEANAIKTIRNKDIDDIVNTFEAYIKKRLGLSLDIAYGTFLNFPTKTFGYSIVPRQSFWLTPSYNFEKGLNFLRASAVLRYEWYDLNYYQKYFPAARSFSNNFDYGVAITSEFKKFTVQLEAVGRSGRSFTKAGTDASGETLYRKSSDSDFQCVGSLSYRINDQIAVSYSLGDGFDSILNQGRTLISMLSLNFGFGGPAKRNLNTE